MRGNINKPFFDFTKLFCLFFITDKSAIILRNGFVNDINLNFLRSSSDIHLDWSRGKFAGTHIWVENLKWTNANEWRAAPRKLLLVNDVIEGYVKQYRNLKMFWINRAGHTVSHNAWTKKNHLVGEGTLPWAIFRFRIFSNYFSQKFEITKITVWKSDNLTIYGIFCLDLYQYYYI